MFPLKWWILRTALLLDELNEVEVLYGLAKAYWSEEIATQAAIAAIIYGFNGRFHKLKLTLWKNSVYMEQTDLESGDKKIK